jgi:hypothetical protein
VLAAKEAKHEAKKQLIIGLIGKLKLEAANKIKSTGVDIDKTKKIVEKSVFISTLNQIMDTEHSKLFSWYYKN